MIPTPVGTAPLPDLSGYRMSYSIWQTLNDSARNPEIHEEKEGH